MDNRRIRLAPYLTGALWRLRTETRTFLLFNSLPIARRDVGEEDWMAIAPNWKVTNATTGKVIVRFNGNLGVVVSIAQEREAVS